MKIDTWFPCSTPPLLYLKYTVQPWKIKMDHFKIYHAGFTQINKMDLWAYAQQICWAYELNQWWILMSKVVHWILMCVAILALIVQSVVVGAWSGPIDCSKGPLSWCGCWANFNYSHCSSQQGSLTQVAVDSPEWCLKLLTCWMNSYQCPAGWSVTDVLWPILLRKLILASLV